MQWLINIIADVVMKRFEGMILIYSGPANEVPAGWQYCDGTNGTPNLIEKFVCCEGGYLPHGTEAGWPVHNHDEGITSDVGVDHQAGVGIAGGVNWSRFTKDHKHDVSMADANHLPPFMALAYIMKTP